MKRNNIIISASIFCLTAALYLFIRSANIVPAENRLASVNDSEISQSAYIKDLNFFPLEEKIVVDIDFSEIAASELSHREKQNQVRDWLLYSILSNINLSETKLNEALFDLPIIRYGFNENLSNLDYGPTRSRAVDDHTVLAIIPKSGIEEQKDHIAHIADLQRKNSGAIPDSMLIFEYQVDNNLAQLYVKRKQTLLVKDVFSEAYGYHETKVVDLRDLEDFMDKVQDLTYVKNHGTGLTLGGRALKNRKHKNISVEDIAAIWQSEEKVQKLLAQYEREEDVFNRKWASKTYQYESARQELEAQRDAEFAALQKKYSEQKIVDGSGFSLDWEYDYESIIQELKAFLPDLLNEEVSATTADRSFSSNGQLQELLDPIVKSKTRTLSEALIQKDIVPLLGMADRFINSENFLDQLTGEYINDIIKENTYQYARYDGDLQGTEVGMTLFYTDLIAKLWTLDYKYTTPKYYIPEIVTHVNNDVANIYASEGEAFSSVRLWFGPNQESFQIGHNDDIFFERNATKVFSASSNMLKPGEEVPATASMGRPIEWWNDHIDEIATYEPQYEALNEIIKWSLVIGWLNPSGNSHIDYLHNVEVNRSNRFPMWIKKHPELKFQKWFDMGFHPMNYLGNATETLPLKDSPPIYRAGQEGGYVYGGVSLASKKFVKETPRLLTNAPKQIQRAGLKNIINDGSKKIITSVREVEYTLSRSFKTNRLTVKTQKDVRLRNNFTEFYKSREFHRTLSRQSDQTLFDASVQEASIGSLNIKPTHNGFSIGFRSKTVDAGNQIARKLSTSSNPHQFLIQNRGRSIDDFVTLRENSHYFIRTKGTNQLMEVELANRPEVNLASKWDVRSSGYGKDAKIIRQRWINQTEASDIAKQYNAKIPDATSPKQYDPKIWDEYNNGRYKEITREVLTETDPAKLWWSIESSRVNEYKIIDEMMLKPELHTACYERIGNLLKIHGEQPDLLLRRAMLELQTKSVGGIKSGIYDLNKAMGKGVKGKSKFLDEVNHLISRDQNLSVANKEIINEYANYQVGKTNHLFVSTENVPLGNQVSPEVVIAKLENGSGKLVIPRNDPRLNHLDWNISTHQTLNKVLETYPDAILTKLPKTSLGSYKLETGVTLEVPNSMTLPSYRIQPIIRNYGDASGNECEDHEIDCMQEYQLYLPSAI